MDPGIFGPRSESWQVHREAAVMIGGARALLMHAAHPLVVAGARQTGMYTTDPWTRLERTLRLNYLVTFGTRAQAESTARHINLVHEQIHGTDEVTGLDYDALDPDLLLWVHACLVDTTLRFERLVVGRLDDAGRQRFLEESMVAAEMMRLPRSAVPPTVEALNHYIKGVIESGILRQTDGSRAVGRLIAHPPPETPRRPLWHLISLWSFGLLPAEVKRIYGVRWNPVKSATLRASLKSIRHLHPLLPEEWRLIPPARSGEARLAGRAGFDEPVSTVMPGNLQVPGAESG